MKKLCLLLALIMLAQPLAFAGFGGGSGSVNKKTTITATLLDDSPTSYTSSAVSVENANRVLFFWTTNETEVGASVSAALTIDVSFDGTTWLTGYSFYDIAGGSTAQTSESLAADGSYVCWLGENTIPPYVRVKVTGTATDADDTSANTVYVFAK